MLFLKLLSDLLDNHPFSFLPVLKSSLDLICFSCFTAEGQKLVFQRFSIFALNLLKQTLLCVEYKPPKNPDHEQGKIFYSQTMSYTIRQIASSCRE